VILENVAVGVFGAFIGGDFVAAMLSTGIVNDKVFSVRSLGLAIARGGDPVADPQGHAQGRGPPAPRQEPVAPTRMTVMGAGLCLPTPFALLRELRAS
jgi:hypothetical protein